MQTGLKSEAVTGSGTATNRAIVRAIARGGLAVGVLDATDGVIFYAVTAGMDPLQVLQYIASGALGARAFEGGLAAAGLGALIHFALAYGFTAAFVFLYAAVPRLRKAWVSSSLAWGVAVWAFMNLLVLPHLSRVAPATLTVAGVVNGIVGHALTVGLAAAVVARRAGVGRG